MPSACAAPVGHTVMNDAAGRIGGGDVQGDGADTAGGHAAAADDGDVRRCRSVGSGRCSNAWPSTVGLLRVSAIRAGVTPTYDWLSGNQPSTSTTTCAAPALLKIEMLPLAPTLVMTELATVCPALKLRFDASGRAAPVGHTVRYDAADRLGDRDVQRDGADTRRGDAAAADDDHGRLDTGTDLAGARVLPVDGRGCRRRRRGREVAVRTIGERWGMRSGFRYGSA